MLRFSSFCPTLACTTPASLKRLRVAAFLTLLMRNNFQSLQRLGVAALKLNFEMNPGNSGTIGSVGNVDLEICQQNYITQRKLGRRKTSHQELTSRGGVSLNVSLFRSRWCPPMMDVPLNVDGGVGPTNEPVNEQSQCVIFAFIFVNNKNG
jgi:hypothetical protein